MDVSLNKNQLWVFRALIFSTLDTMSHTRKWSRRENCAIGASGSNQISHEDEEIAKDKSSGEDRLWYLLLFIAIFYVGSILTSTSNIDFVRQDELTRELQSTQTATVISGTHLGFSSLDKTMINDNLYSTSSRSQKNERSHDVKSCQQQCNNQFLSLRKASSLNTGITLISA